MSSKGIPKAKDGSFGKYHATHLHLKKAYVPKTLGIELYQYRLETVLVVRRTNIYLFIYPCNLNL